MHSQSTTSALLFALAMAPFAAAAPGPGKIKFARQAASSGAVPSDTAASSAPVASIATDGSGPAPTTAPTPSTTAPGVMATGPGTAPTQSTAPTVNPGAASSATPTSMAPPGIGDPQCSGAGALDHDLIADSINKYVPIGGTFMKLGQGELGFQVYSLNTSEDGKHGVSFTSERKPSSHGTMVELSYNLTNIAYNSILNACKGHSSGFVTYYDGFFANVELGLINF